MQSWITKIGMPGRLERKDGFGLISQKLENFYKSLGIEEDLTPHCHKAAKYLKRELVKLGRFPRIKKEWLFETVEEYKNIPRENRLSQALKLLGRPEDKDDNLKRAGSYTDKESEARGVVTSQIGAGSDRGAFPKVKASPWGHGQWRDLAEKQERNNVEKWCYSWEDQKEGDLLCFVLSLDSGSLGGWRAVFKPCLWLGFRTFVQQAIPLDQRLAQ